MLIDEVNKHLDTGICSMATQNNFKAEALDDFLETIGSKVAATVALEADDEILIQRLLEEEKLVVGLTTKMKKKRNRYQEYNEKTAPLMGYYNKARKVLRRKWNRDNPGNLNV
jgi:adenylate kinase